MHAAAPAGPPIVSVRDLHVRFRTQEAVVHAVNGISFDLAAGEVLGILGESGSGKSVTLRALIGLLPRRRTEIEGRIQVAGHDLSGMEERSLRRVRGAKAAMIFQEPMIALDPVFTIGEQIAETIIRHEGASHADARARGCQLLRGGADPSAARRLRQHRTRCPGACGFAR